MGILTLWRTLTAASETVHEGPPPPTLVEISDRLHRLEARQAAREAEHLANLDQLERFMKRMQMRFMREPVETHSDDVNPIYEQKLKRHG